MTCRICNAETLEIIDFGQTPLANRLATKKSDRTGIEEFPLVLEHCTACLNFQLRTCVDKEILYRDYVYSTPNSKTLDTHYAFLTSRLTDLSVLDETKHVVEVGSNVGRFLDFVKPNAASILGVDPAQDLAAVANDAGIETVADFFNLEVAERIRAERGPADLIAARHCFAHNEHPEDMLAGMSALLSDTGAVLIENAYALNTITGNEFDQVYHEHMYYYTLSSLRALLAKFDLEVFDASIGLVHGGSIVVLAGRKGAHAPTKSLSLIEIIENRQLTADSIETFRTNSLGIMTSLKALVSDLNAQGFSICSYGATAKGNTLLNTCNIDDSMISACLDSTPQKQGLFLPGSNIPIISETALGENHPDFFLLTAWNYKDEIIQKVRNSGNYHSRFIIPFPSVHVV